MIMEENNFLQGLGFKGRGLIVVLFLMGLIMHLLNIIYPVGVAIMIVAAILLIVDIIIDLNDKAIKSKRGY